MARKLVIAALLAVIAASGWLAWRYDPNFPEEIFAEIFWLALGTLVVTFALETVLAADADRRRRRADRLHFRTLCAGVVNALGEITKLEDRREAELLTAVSQSQARFTAQVEQDAERLRTATGFDAKAYKRHYLNIDSRLRDIATNFIRLLVDDEAEMVRNYRALNSLANRWEYVHELEESEGQALEFDGEELARMEARLTKTREEHAAELEASGPGKFASRIADDVAEQAKRVEELSQSIARQDQLRSQAFEDASLLIRDTIDMIVEMNDFAVMSPGMAPP
ncbi:MAG: hypothetical protein AAF401_08900 [Pseudomonadota bacterium]